MNNSINQSTATDSLKSNLEKERGSELCSSLFQSAGNRPISPSSDDVVWEGRNVREGGYIAEDEGVFTMV